MKAKKGFFLVSIVNQIFKSKNLISVLEMTNFFFSVLIVLDKSLINPRLFVLIISLYFYHCITLSLSLAPWPPTFCFWVPRRAPTLGGISRRSRRHVARHCQAGEIMAIQRREPSERRCSGISLRGWPRTGGIFSRGRTTATLRNRQINATKISRLMPRA